jgi:hypothetical protein
MTRGMISTEKQNTQQEEKNKEGAQERRGDSELRVRAHASKHTLPDK